MKFSQKYISRHKALNELNTELPALDALHALQVAILTLDPDASIGINNAEQTLTWSSRKLTEAITVNVLETTKGCSLWIESCDLDHSIVSELSNLYTFKHIETCGGDEEDHARSVFDVLTEFLNDDEWKNYVEIIPSAIKSAKSSPYSRLRRLREVLENLAIFSLARKQRDYTSLTQLAVESGLGNTYRPNISFTARSKYRAEYEFNYNGELITMCEHLTLGGGCNDRQCMSINFYWDETKNKIIVGHIGRHGTNTLTNT
jgi:hypothetical protein